jgi:hypothetical protein
MDNAISLLIGRNTSPAGRESESEASQFDHGRGRGRQGDLMGTLSITLRHSTASLGLLAAGGIGACGDSPTVPPTEPPASPPPPAESSIGSVVVTPNPIDIAPNGITQLTASVRGVRKVPVQHPSDRAVDQEIDSASYDRLACEILPVVVRHVGRPFDSATPRK